MSSECISWINRVGQQEAPGPCIGGVLSLIILTEGGQIPVGRESCVSIVPFVH